jgi:hypothetical protein
LTNCRAGISPQAGYFPRHCRLATKPAEKKRGADLAGTEVTSKQKSGRVFRPGRSKL